jgi:large subunit ribosomal protein L9
MKIILKEDVDNLGDMGNVVEVKNGYGRNYLIPRDLAVEANTKNIKQLEHQKKLLQSKIKKAKLDGEELSTKISSISISIEVKSGEDGKLFGSVTSKDIAEAIAAQGIEIDKRKINLQEPIKRLGEYEIHIRVRQDVNATVKLEVKSSEVVAAPEASDEAKTEEPKDEEVKASEEATEVDPSESTEA